MSSLSPLLPPPPLPQLPPLTPPLLPQPPPSPAAISGRRELAMQLYLRCPDIRQKRGCLADPAAPGTAASNVCGYWILSPGSAGDPEGMQWYFGFGSVSVGFKHSNFARSGALATVGFGRSGVLQVIVDLVALSRLNCCGRWRLQLRLLRWLHCLLSLR